MHAMNWHVYENLGDVDVDDHDEVKFHQHEVF
jgi:hypothetical protein